MSVKVLVDAPPHEHIPILLIPLLGTSLVVVLVVIILVLVPLLTALVVIAVLLLLAVVVVIGSALRLADECVRRCRWRIRTGFHRSRRRPAAHIDRGPGPGRRRGTGHTAGRRGSRRPERAAGPRAESGRSRRRNDLPADVRTSWGVIKGCGVEPVRQLSTN
jgi:hypothetical protein